ncbi:MAG: hypothetical protein ACJ72N_11260 [Labedaea sp.]
MQWTPELVSAEMEYRRRSARLELVAETLRAARKTHPARWRRLLSQ